MAQNNMLKITLVRSTIGEKPKTRAAVETLGLRKIRQSVTVVDTPQNRGMIDKISYLVSVEEV